MLTMAAPVDVTAGANMTEVHVADMNHDGHQDVVGLNPGGGSIGVILGNGDGTFQPMVTSLAGGVGTKISLGDFNHDGNEDVVTIQGAQVKVHNGNGDGSLQTPAAYYASAYPNDVDVGDVNNDGFDDIFTASFSYGGTTQLFMNDGTGSGNFLPSHNLSIGPTGLQIEGADVDGDGNLDLVQSSGSGAIAVLVGHGDGTFISASPQYIGMSTRDIDVDDFNHDGKLDLVVTNGSQVSVFAGNGADVFQSPTSYSVASSSGIKTGDLNGDGARDVVSNDGYVLLGRGDGGFFAPTMYGTPVGSSIALGDLNEDGAVDAIAGTTTPGAGVAVSLNANNDQLLLAGATQISIVAAGSASAGTPFAVTVTALDADGNIATDFLGTVSVMGAPGTRPVSYTFTAADSGIHTIANAATLFNAGAGTVSVASPFLPDSTGSVDVVAGAAANFAVSTPATARAGDATTVTVSAYDAYGNFSDNFLGTVHLTSSDSQALLPSDYTFTADDAGVHTFDVTLKTAGARTVKVQSTTNAAVKGTSAATTVTAADAVSLTLTGGGGYVGSTNAVTITARDPFGNIATSYNGVVHLTASDPNATTSPDAALVNGVGTFTVTPVTMGAQSLSATDVATGALVGSENITVTPGWGVRFAAAPLPTTMAAGQSASTQLTIYDAYGNVSTVFTGWVAITSTDARATNYVYFSPSDAGVKSVPVTLYTAGVQAVTISDYANPGVTFTQIGITVTPGAVASIAVTPLHGTVAGTAQDFAVSARDLYGNVATNYSGTVTFASTDTQAILPPTYTFTEADAGSHVFSATFLTSGGQDITIADTTTNVVPQYYVTNTMTYYQHDVWITAASLSTFNIKAASSSNTTAGDVIGATLIASDAYGNPITDFTGTVQFTSTDPKASLPGSYTFTSADAGEHAFTFALKTAGAQSISVSNGTVSGGLPAVTVKAAAFSKLAISTATTSTAGTAQDVTVTATDAYGNPVTNYSGTVQFSSSDTGASLPAAYTFTKKDSGTHTFSVNFKTAGTQSLTVTDSVNATAIGTVSGIVVTKAMTPVVSFTVSGFPATTAGTAKSFTVTARDAAGNIVTGYTGTIVFSSSDVKAGLPASYTFTGSDSGAHTFTATLKTAGTQSITVRDASTSTVIGTQSGIVVTAGSVAQFVASAPTSVNAGSGFKFTLTAYDAYGNLATNYAGKVQVTSTDPKAGSSSYSYSTKDAGVHIFSYTFSTTGTQYLTITDPTNPSLTTKVAVLVLAK